MENERAKIKILKRGNMSFVDVKNIDIESEGIMNMKNTNFNDAGYINKKGGVTNIDGEFNSTGTLIKNEGIFNISKTGRVNIFRLSKKHPVIVFSSIIIGILAIIKLLIEIVKLF